MQESRKFCFNEVVTSVLEYIEDSPVVECIYEIIGISQNECLVLPDGKIDIVIGWKGTKQERWILFAGSEISMFSLQGCTSLVGIRYKPGIRPEFIGDKMCQTHSTYALMDEISIIPDALENLSPDMAFEDMKKCMLEVVDKIGICKTNGIVNKLIDEIGRTDENINIDGIALRSGYCHHYLEKIFKQNIGISIKKYTCVCRIQKGIGMILTDMEENILDELHYYDQSHFIHEFKRFTSYTPNELKQKINEQVIYLI